MLVIRKATERDIEAVCRLIGQMSPMGFRHDYTNAVDKFRSTSPPTRITSSGSQK